MATFEIPILLDTPDAAGAAQLEAGSLDGLANRNRNVRAFPVSVDSSWEGAARVPQNYQSAGAVVVTAIANATTGAVRWAVSSAVAAAGASEDGAWVDEAAQTVVVPATAKIRFDTSFVLTSVPVAGATLNVKVTRNGLNAGDTLAVRALLWECIFRYTGA